MHALIGTICSHHMRYDIDLASVNVTLGAERPPQQVNNPLGSLLYSLQGLANLDSELLTTLLNIFPLLPLLCLRRRRRRPRDAFYGRGDTSFKKIFFTSQARKSQPYKFGNNSSIITLAMTFLFSFLLAKKVVAIILSIKSKDASVELTRNNEWKQLNA